MEFDKIFTEKRVGSDKIPIGVRSGFQRDFDRLIFSSAFRRLQGKTQVFPLPGTSFVHNRLTHSLEVASVGRSLGKIVGEEISSAYEAGEEAFEFYKYELANVVAAACLAHDIGNPAFGHSGEKAISAYFLENQNETIDSTFLQKFFQAKEWQDLISFEGNANAVRILCHSYEGRFSGGFGLTYTTIASILKYPCESGAVDKSFRHRKKYGFFQSEKELVQNIANDLGMKLESEDPLSFQRHPVVYLVEAADDICYSIVDMEDAHRLKILSTTEVEGCYLHLLRALTPDTDRTLQHYHSIKDKNESIAFLRARLINQLVRAASQVFLDSKTQILAGIYNSSLVDQLNHAQEALKEIEKISVQKIYGHDTVVEVELAGYNVMSELLKLFVPALLRTQPDHKDKKILRLLPEQFSLDPAQSRPYERVMNALDHISGMTDEYATEMYRRMKGIVIPKH